MQKSKKLQLNCAFYLFIHFIYLFIYFVCFDFILLHLFIHSFIHLFISFIFFFCSPATADYQPLGELLTFDSAITILEVNVTLIDDSETETSERFRARLAEVTTGTSASVSPNTAQVTILDNDGEFLTDYFINTINKWMYFIITSGEPLIVNYAEMIACCCC